MCIEIAIIHLWIEIKAAFPIVIVISKTFDNLKTKLSDSFPVLPCDQTGKITWACPLYLSIYMCLGLPYKLQCLLFILQLLRVFSYRWTFPKLSS